MQMSASDPRTFTKLNQNTIISEHHGAPANAVLDVDSVRYHRLDGNRREHGSRPRALRQGLGLDRRDRWTAKSACTLRAWQPSNPRSLKRAENIVLRAEGMAQLRGVSTAVKLTVTKLTVGPIDPRLFIIPDNFNKSGY